MFLNLAPLRQDPVFAAFEQLLAEPRGGRAESAVRVNGYQSDAAYVLVLEVPGLSADQIEVKVEQGGLTVQGKGAPIAPEGQHPLHRELPTRLEFRRRFSFAEDADLDQASASLKDGLLHIHIPRRAPGARRIAVVAA